MWIVHGWVVSRFRSWHKGNLTLQLGVVIIWCDNLKMAKNRLISQLVCHYKTLYVKGASRMHYSRWIYKVHLCMILWLLLSKTFWNSSLNLYINDGCAPIYSY